MQDIDNTFSRTHEIKKRGKKRQPKKAVQRGHSYSKRRKAFSVERHKRRPIRTQITAERKNGISALFEFSPHCHHPETTPNVPITSDIFANVSLSLCLSDFCYSLIAGTHKYIHATRNYTHMFGLLPLPVKKRTGKREGVDSEVCEIDSSTKKARRKFDSRRSFKGDLRK